MVRKPFSAIPKRLKSASTIYNAYVVWFSKHMQKKTRKQASEWNEIALQNLNQTLGTNCLIPYLWRLIWITAA